MLIARYEDFVVIGWCVGVSVVRKPNAPADVRCWELLVCLLWEAAPWATNVGAYRYFGVSNIPGNLQL